MNDVAPLSLHEESVRPEWVDFNGHMNLAYYVLAFDHATDRFLHHVGLGEAYMRATGRSIFVLETHVVYRREMQAHDPMRFTTQLLGHDAKRIQFIHHMYHAREGHLSAANEIMGLHVDLGTRRAAPFPQTVMDTLARLLAQHRRLPLPPEAGRVITLDRRGGRGVPGNSVTNR